MAEIGVLALQGDFELHVDAVRRSGGSARTVRTGAELAGVDALIIPGGESTTMLKLIEYKDLWEPLRAFGARKPVLGTCAGAILSASEVLNPRQASFGFVDMTIERNAYGRQVDSRIVRVTDHELGGDAELEVVLIRAPIIRRVGDGGRVLARYNGDPILVDYGRHLMATFHPEATRDPRVHGLFLRRAGQVAAD